MNKIFYDLYSHSRKLPNYKTRFIVDRRRQYIQSMISSHPSWLKRSTNKTTSITPLISNRDALGKVTCWTFFTCSRYYFITNCSKELETFWTTWSLSLWTHRYKNDNQWPKQYNFKSLLDFSYLSGCPRILSILI